MDNILNKHSDLPWEQRDTEIIGKYGSNETICEMILTGNHNELANAAFICKAVNNYDSLLEALKDMIFLNDTTERNLTPEWKQKLLSAKNLMDAIKAYQT